MIKRARIISEPGSAIDSFSRRYWRTIVAAPAATAVDIDEPLRVIYRGFPVSLCVDGEQLSPSVNCASFARAEHIITPGATRSGLMRPSRVVPLEEVEDTAPDSGLPYDPVVEDPIVNTFFAVPGGVMLSYPFSPKSPAENNTRKLG